MIRFYTNRHRVYSRTQRIPFLRKFVVFNIFYFSRAPENSLHEMTKGLRYGDATGKETVSGRFDDLDDLLLERIENGYELHDVGVSNGITSLELANKLEASGKIGNIYISDKFARVNVQRGLCQKVFDLDGKLLSVYCAGIYMDGRMSWAFPISRLLFYPFAALTGRPAAENFVWTLLPAVLERIRDGRLNYIDYDVFRTGIDGKFSVVRCMNLLNLVYFEEADIVQAVRNIVRSLQDGGVFLVGRTKEGGINSASFYRKRDGRILLEETLNGGSEIDPLIDRL